MFAACCQPVLAPPPRKTSTSAHTGQSAVQTTLYFILQIYEPEALDCYYAVFCCAYPGPARESHILHSADESPYWEMSRRHLAFMRHEYATLALLVCRVGRLVSYIES